MDERAFIKLESKLDCIINLLSFQIVNGMNKSQAAPLLNNLGVETKNIAIVLNMSVESARSRISENKRDKSNGDKDE